MRLLAKGSSGLCFPTWKGPHYFRMIPLKTLPDAKHAPLCTRAISVVIGLVWLVQLALLFFRQEDLAQVWGVRPACYLHPSSCGVDGFALPSGDLARLGAWIGSGTGHLFLALFVSLWLHADWLHVGFNVLFLLVFGGALESEMGRLKFVWLYLTGGLLAAACHIVFNLSSYAPTIGASGAIAAVLGAHFWRMPRAWVLTYFPPVFVFPVPSPLFGLLWIGAQVAGAWGNLHLPFMGNAGGSQIAWMAHMGGFSWGAWTGWRSGKRRGTSARANVSQVNIGK